MSLLIAAAFMIQANIDPSLQERFTKPPPPRVNPTARQKNDSAIGAAGNGQTINTIEFRGTEAPARVARAAQAFLGQPATKDVLTQLAAAMSAAYDKTDVAIYTIQIPDQDFAGGRLIVDLAEGSIDKVNIKSAANDRFPLVSRRAGVLVGEKPLSRHHLERQLALIQSIPGLTLDANLDNPEGDDTVALNLVPKQKRVSGSVGINNRGSHLLGDTVLQAGVDVYRALTDGDRLSFSGYATPDFRHYRAIDASYLVPLTASGLTLTATGALIATQARTIDVKGTAKLAGVSLSYPVVRHARFAADVSVGIDGVNSNNALFGNIFATERTRALRVTTAVTAAPGTSTVQFTGSASHGLDIFDAFAGLSGAELDFTKFNLEAAFEQPIGKRVVGRLHGLAQYSDDRLPAVELMSIGGPIGRAFDTGILTGDSGMGGFAELAYRPIASGNFAASEAYVFADAGEVHFNPRPGIAAQTYRLSSAGAGVRANYKDRFLLGLEAAAVLSRPYPAYDEDYRLSFYYSAIF